MTIIGDYFEGRRRSREDAQREHEDADRAHHDSRIEHHDEQREHADSRRHDDDEQKEISLLRESNRLHREEIALLRQLVAGQSHPKLSSIKIQFGGFTMPVGPITLTVGQSATATVQGFDQNSAPLAIDFTDPNFAVAWTVDNAGIASSTPNPDQSSAVVGVSAGVANLTATCAGFSDTETVTVVAQAPILSSVKISFA